MVVDQQLPLGLVANTSAVLAMTIGAKIRGIIGGDVVDGDGQHHCGITNLPIPLLRGDGNLIRSIRRDLISNSDDLFWVDFCDVAQKCVDYDDYTKKIGNCRDKDLNYLGIALYGPKKRINKLTGSLGLLR